LKFIVYNVAMTFILINNSNNHVMFSVSFPVWGFWSGGM